MNNPEANNLRRSRLSLVLFLVSIVLLVIVGGYLVYAQRQEQASQGSTNLVLNNSQTELKETETVNQVTNETTPASTENKQTETRDPKRYYNDKDGYSFIVPNNYQIRSINEVPGYENSEDKGLALDTSFDYKYPKTDDPDSNPDIRLLIAVDPDGDIDRVKIEDSSECQKKDIRNLEIIECRYENQLLGGNSINVNIYQKNKGVFLLSHDKYEDAIDIIVESFSWL